jgi:hypothetical protein
MSELGGRQSGLLSHKALKENYQNPLTALLSKECPAFSEHKTYREKRHCHLISFYQQY